MKRDVGPQRATCRIDVEVQNDADRHARRGAARATTACSESPATRVWVTWCDQVAIHPRTIARLVGAVDACTPTAPIVMPVAFRKNPYIHLERDSERRIVRVLHRREGDTMPEVGESDAGLFSFSRDAFLTQLPDYAASLETGAGTGERNLLPFIPWIAERATSSSFPCVDEMEAVGINTPEELQDGRGASRPGAQRQGPVDCDSGLQRRALHRHAARSDQGRRSDARSGSTRKSSSSTTARRDRTAEIVAGPGRRDAAADGAKRRQRRAVRAGIAAATGDYLIIQDADLEYDPQRLHADAGGALRRAGRRRLWQPLPGSRQASRASRGRRISADAA